MHVNQVSHLFGKILLGSLRRYAHVPPALQRLEQQKEVAGPFALVFVVNSFNLSWFGLNCWTCLADQLVGAFIKTYHRILSHVLFCIQVEDVLHMTDKLSADARQAPFGYKPGLEVVFFSVRRTVSSLRLSSSVSATSLSASSCMVQRARPCGGVEQAVATRSASCLPSSLRLAPGRLASLRARSRLPSTKRL